MLPDGQKDKNFNTANRTAYNNSPKSFAVKIQQQKRKQANN